MEQINKYDFLHGLKNNMDKEYQTNFSLKKKSPYMTNVNYGA